VSNIRVGRETEGTISIDAPWRLDRSGTMPSLVITIDPGDLAEIGGTGWQFDTVLDVGSAIGTDLTLRYVPNGADEA
jgi:hypothetical protein